MAYYPANSTYPSMLGELFSAAFTAPAFNWICSPAVTELETIVLDWLAGIFNLPACYLSEGEGGGVIHGSASEAVLTVMVAARERYLETACKSLEGEEKERKKAEVRGRLVALGSEQSHSCTAKGALIAGVRFKSIHCSLEDDLAMTGAGLDAMLDECKREGLEPFYLTATLGTTATCTTDRFREIKDVVKAHPDIWVHVDAAYAGAALVCEEYQHHTEHFAAFDSFNMNMHKWLLTNFDARYAPSPKLSSRLQTHYYSAVSSSATAHPSPPPSLSPHPSSVTISPPPASSQTTATGRSPSGGASAP